MAPGVVPVTNFPENDCCCKFGRGNGLTAYPVVGHHSQPEEYPILPQAPSMVCDATNITEIIDHDICVVPDRSWFPPRTDCSYCTIQQDIVNLRPHSPAHLSPIHLYTLPNRGFVSSPWQAK